jgi:hypothetical protein
MRLIAWNANFNNRRRSFDQDLSVLGPLCPDIVVLSETGPGGPTDSSVGLTPPHLSVASFNGYTVEPSERNHSAPAYSASFRVAGPVQFTLLACWPVLRTKQDKYSALLDQILSHFRPLVNGFTILAGDLNSSSAVTGQRRSHPRFVANCEGLRLHSVYHHLAGEEHGRESTFTYVHGKENPSYFHLDYCMVSERLLPAASLSIPQMTEWLALSDHVPLILDIPNVAFR